MKGPPAPLLTVEALQRLLAQTDPAALLVPPRILRRVIKKDRALIGLGLQVPHRKSYVIARDRLLEIADREELGVRSELDLPATLLLFPRPDRTCFSSEERDAALLKYWRLLFHTRIHVALEEQRDRVNVRERMVRIGLTEFDEAVAVLRQEHFLLPPADEEAVYEEFACVYLELRYFARQQLPLYFPACSHPETIEAILTEDVDAAGLFTATRLPGAPDPPSQAIVPLDEVETLAEPTEESTVDQPLLSVAPGDAPRAYRRLLQRAERASARRNMVRAAIFRMRAVALAPAGQINPTRAAALREMEQFCRRLQKVLVYSDASAGDWQQALFALLERAATRGIWPSEARMLYDLQKVCIDQERPVFAVDLVEWFCSWGRRPIKRLLPFHDSVLMVKHLRSAMHRLTVIRISEPLRRRLITLLIEASHHCEKRLRERLRPVLRGAFDKVGLIPRNIAEQVARDKVAEELIDRVVERGFLGMGDLRDAIARNRLKLPELTDSEGRSDGSVGQRVREWCAATGRGLRNFFVGDPLIRANRQLAADLDGVYHRGEIYLRWLQRLSALAFGTFLGRLLTLYVVLPFGCSIALIKVWDEFTELGEKLWKNVLGQTSATEASPSSDLGEEGVESDETGEEGDESREVAKAAAHHINGKVFLGLGLFFLALFHVPIFQHSLALVCLYLWRGLRWLLIRLPGWFLHLPWVERFLQSRPWLFMYQFVLKPLPWSALCTLLLLRLHQGLPAALGVGAAMFLLTSLLLNSRLGVYVEEIATDSLVRTWYLIRLDLVPGLVRWLIYLFRRLQEEVERLLYTVDEWMRFRPGDSRLSFFLKPVLGLVWFIFTYLFRMIFNVFVEPTFNPIKHFPAVTVAAKLMAPLYITLPREITDSLAPLMGKVCAGLLAWCIIGLLPGLAGFLVWEFKENWRLYRANQSPTLTAELIGHHGETVLRLLRPGLHSGTVPKLYARLRHGRRRATRRQYEALHHLRERLRQFVERNLFAVLSGSKSWGNATPLSVGEIQIATNRIRIEIAGMGASIHVDLEEHGGWLVAGLACPNATKQTWLASLHGEQTIAFRDALAGFYKRAGVAVVREQVESLLPSGMAFDLKEEGLLVFARTERNGEMLYPLTDGGDAFLQTREASSQAFQPPLLREAILYTATPLRWDDWVQTWQLDHDGNGHAPLLPTCIRLLPRSD
jgi:hypothetical protein